MSSDPSSAPHVAFLGHHRLAAGTRAELAAAVAAVDVARDGPLLVFDSDGRQVELDLRGGPDRAGHAASPPVAPAPPRGRGRPQLGVVAREVTLLPRHWEWLAAQPGGASVTLRRLVEEARRHAGGADTVRAAQERAYRFLTAIAGNLPGYEAALRALFAGDRAAFETAAAAWPHDITLHAHLLAAGAFADENKP